MGRNSVTDFNRIPSFIRNLSKGLDHGLEELGKDTVRKIDDGFENGHDALDRPWEPLSPETIRQKGHGDILIEDGNLRDSIDFVVEDRKLEIYSDDPKVEFHEDGTMNIPRRPILEPAGIYAEKNIREQMGAGVDMAYNRSRAGMGIGLATESGGGLINRLGGLL